MKLYEKILLGIVVVLFGLQFFPITGSGGLIALAMWLLAASYAIGGYKIFKPIEKITLVFSIIAGICFATSLVVIPYAIRLNQNLVIKILPTFNSVFFIIACLYIFLNKKSIQGILPHLKSLLIRSAIILIITSFFCYCPVSFKPYRKIMIAMNQGHPDLISNLEMFDYGAIFESALKNKDCDAAIEAIEKARQAGESWLGIIHLPDGSLSKEDSSRLWQIGGVYTKMYEAYKCKADFYYAEERYKDALAMYLKADPYLYVDSLQTTYWEIEKSYSTNCIALCHKFLSDYKLADSLFLIAINQYKTVKDTNDINVCIFLANIAESYSQQEYYSNSNIIYKKVIDLLLKDSTNADNKKKLVSNYIYLAKNYIHMDSLQSAINYLEKVKEISDENDQDYCTAKIYYGACLYSMSKYWAADSVLHECLDCYKKHLEPTHENFGGAYLMLAKINLALARYKEVEKYINMGKALSIKNNGEKSLNYAIWLKTLGALYTETGNYRESEKLTQNAFELTNKFLGTPNKDQPEMLSELAYVNLIFGNFNKARLLSDSSVSINSLYYNQNSVGNTSLLNKVAYVNYCIGQYKMSSSLYEKTIHINKEYKMEGSATTAIALNGLGLIMTEKKEFSKADSLFEQSLKLHKEIFGDNHPFTAVVYLDYGVLKIKEKKLEEAKKMLQHSEIINKEFYDKHHDIFADIAIRLADIAVLENQRELARDYYQQAQNIYTDKFGEKYYKIPQVESKLKYLK
jgi:tetratricopeptide (TPR) repeat protein